MTTPDPFNILVFLLAVSSAAVAEPVDSVLEDKRDHWSFKPVSRPALPEIGNTGWPRREMDPFILARLEKEGLKPAPEADRATWLRRVSFDLIGLPPSPEAVETFVNDPGDDAFERKAEELLNSPRYGERWAQHWLDVVRYADTHGFEVNTERPNAWPYRDYVIESFNNDTPYDRFIREQIAGDAMDKDAATGFLVTASVLLPGQIGADDISKRLARQDSLDEIVVNTGQTFLGLSVGCARCHDHKFDPITSRDYYSMQAFFAGVEYGDRELRTPEALAQRKEAESLKNRVTEKECMLAQYLYVPGGNNSRRSSFSTSELNVEEARQVEVLTTEIKSIEAKIAAAAVGQMAFAGTFRKPDTIHLLNRGDPEQPGEEVTPAVLKVLGLSGLPKDITEMERRKALADWIASPQNPLTARVMVNRIWQGHFGTGLVETPSDFGRNGARPSHPELLDWLAFEFIRSGWSVKHMHRLVVLSATYRQSSGGRDPYPVISSPSDRRGADSRNTDSLITEHSKGRQIDADVHLLWRFPSRRLESESIRDSMLAVSGWLNLKMGGRGFDLFDNRGGLSGFNPVESFRGDGLRRMIYAHKVRREREAVFGAFDCPDAGQSTARRRESTTPIQALNLFNSRFTIEQADAFAARVKTDAGDDITQQIQHAYRLALSRNPDPEEIADAAPAVRAHGLPTLCRALFNSNEFLFMP